MSDVLHYLDKLEYRPNPKPKAKVLLKTRPDVEKSKPDELKSMMTEKGLLNIVDKTGVSGFKRDFIKDFEKIIGTVKEKKRREGEPIASSKIFVDPVFPKEEDYTEIPNVMQQTEPSIEPETEKDAIDETELFDKLQEVETKILEEERNAEKQDDYEGNDLQQDLDHLKYVADKVAVEELVPKPKPGRKKPTEKNNLKIPKVRITETTEIEGAPVLSRVPKQKELNKLIVRAPTYYMANRKLYTTRIADLFKDFSKELLDEKTAVSCDKQGSTTNIDLLIHQRIVREYLNLYTPYRGLLLYHGLGSGKTCTSIAIAEAAKTHKRVFIMTPASLKTNFFSELKKCGDPLYKKNQYWEFISVEGRPEYVSILSQVLSISVDSVLKNGGAWLVDINKTEPNYAELSAENQKSLDAQLNDMIRSKYVDINYNGLTSDRFSNLVSKYADPITRNPFDHSIVLVDEAHNLVSRIVNNLSKPSSVSNKLYEYLKTAQDVRIVFMSGTPIINYPNEMGVLFNMLRGDINTWRIKIPNNIKKLTSESIVKMFRDADFRTYDYVDYSNETLSITRNPFGFINTKKPGIALGMKRNPIEKKTIIRRGGSVQKPPDSDSDSDSDNEASKKTASRKTQKSAKPSSSSSSRKTKRNHTILPKNAPSQQDTVIEHPDYIDFHGALVLRDSVPVKLSDEIKADIAKEVEDEANGNGPDPYHSGGAIVIDDRYNGVHLNEQGDISDVEFVRRVKEILTENGVQFLPEVKVDHYKCLPDNLKEFTDMFVDMNSLSVQRPDVLKKRILGLSSYFRSAQESLLPSFILSDNEYNKQFHIEYVEMSDHQFVDYAKERETEMTREKNSKKSTRAAQNKAIIKVSGTYRTFTRAKCNFSFPDEIPRPMPPAFDPAKDVQAEVVDNVRDDNELDMAEDGHLVLDNEYEKSIVAALEKLKAEQSTYLTPEALKKYSPKFARILENLSNEDNKGLHLVYSAFRTLEGIGILKLILEANGFVEFKIKKTGDTWSIVETDKDPKNPRFVLYTGTETAEEKEIIRNIYNSNWEFVPGNIADQLKKQHPNNYYGEIIKIIMITSSGAEGINLENTRFVHIVEPYWHMVRVDQVVGRARRICSHKNLPEELRTIKVFLYMSKFSDKQKFSGENIKIMDADVSRIKKAPTGSKLGTMAITTDETLFEIAIIKDRLTKQLLKSVKESSVDCDVYNNSKEGLVCYTYGYSTSNEFGSFPSYEEDGYVREGADVVMTEVKPNKITIDGVVYAHNPITNDLYNYKEYAENKRKVLEGKLEIRNGKQFIVK